MATSFPPRPVLATDDVGAAHELVWGLARAQLGAEVTLYPNVSLRRRRLRSADTPVFETAEHVVVDPDHGVTLVVVGQLEEGPDDAAGPATDDTRRACVAVPTLTARARTLRDELAAMLADGDPALGRVPVRWALALPDLDLDHGAVVEASAGALPAAALWDQGAVVGSDALLNAYHALWTVHGVGTADGEGQPGPAVVDRVHRRLVQRSANGVSYLADRLRHDDQRLQGVVPAGLLRTSLAVVAGGSCLVTGGAGSGKTTVGVEVAAAEAARGGRVLLTTPHRAQGNWLRQRLADVLVADGLLQSAVRVAGAPHGRLVVGDVAGLSGAAPGEGEDALRFFDAQAPDWVSPRRFGGRFDLVVVDEWHALAAGHRAALAQMVADGGRLLALADPSLATAGDDLAEQQFPAHHHLDLDVRTVPVLAAARDAALVGDDLPDGPRGGAVTWLPATGDALEGVARTTVDELVADGTATVGDVAVLRLSPGPRVVDPAGQDHLALTLRGRGLVHAPVASFAGLHRPVVVLVLDTDRVEPTTSGEALRQLVALGASRATEHLVVVGDPSAIRLRGLGVIADHLSRAAHPSPEPLGTA